VTVRQQRGERPFGGRTGLWEQLFAPASDDAGLGYWAGSGFERVSWRAVVRRAFRVAAALKKRGISDGSRVACILTNSSAVPPTALGIWLAGGVVVSVPTIARGMDAQVYAAQLRRVCSASASSLLVAERRVLPFLPSAEQLGLTTVALEALDAAALLDMNPPAEDEVVFIQYSSGTTAAPSGCMITAGAVAAQLAQLGHFLRPEPRKDVVLSWLPMSHDMGFFGGLLFPWAHGVSTFLSSPERFLGSPRSWLDDSAEVGATITAVPPSALDLAAHAIERGKPPRPLRLESVVVGGEQIEMQTLTRFAAAAGPAGFTWPALVPAYGLAEATLAVTGMKSDVGPRSVTVDIEGKSRELVCLGSPLDGASVRIDGSDEPGEVVVSSRSLARGYLDDPDKTAARFTGSEVRTGDFGILRAGELYVTGRHDDMFSLGGQNVFATDIEAALREEPGVRPGGCAVVDVGSGAERRVLVLAEPKAGVGELKTIARGLTRRARVATGVEVSEVVFLRHGALPKTPSGKLQRFRCRRFGESDEGVLERIRVRR
jgi:acyl-CoA synthetase (AMP-forming)/AMP-acid ligase II